MITKEEVWNDMKDRNEKWLYFKNFLHHELGVTKEDIREWVKEAVKEEAQRLVNNTYDNFKPERIIKDILFRHDMFEGDHFKKDVIHAAAKLIVEQIKIVPADKTPETPVKPITIGIDRS